MKIKSLFNPEDIKKYIAEYDSLKKSDFHFFETDSKILISSVHGFNHIRNNNIKSKDQGTALFSFLLAKITNSNLIISFQDNNIDSNYHKETNIKKFLQSKQKKFKFLLDIHGCHTYRIPDVEIGNLNRQTFKKKYIKTFKKFLKIYYFIYVENETFSGSGEDDSETMIKYMHKNFSTESIQIEINSSLIIQDTNLFFWHRYYQLLNCLGQIILKYNKKH